MRETENRGAGDERVSMWSVPRRFKAVYFPLFYLLGIIGIGWSVWYESSRIANPGSYHDVANAVVMKLPATLMGAAFISLVITEVVVVLAGMLEDHYKKRDEKTKAKWLAIGREQGEMAGRAQGEAARDSEWEVWFEGYRHAQENGLPFDEPPPSARSKNGTNDDEQPE